MRLWFYPRNGGCYKLGAGVFIKVVCMDVIFKMELLSTYLELYNSKYERNTK
jgi:hypothetical protein